MAKMKALLISVCVLIIFEGYYSRAELIPGLGDLPTAIGCDGIADETPLLTRLLIAKLGLSDLSGNQICKETCDKEGTGECRDKDPLNIKISDGTSKISNKTAKVEVLIIDKSYSNVSNASLSFEELEFLSVTTPADTGISVFLKTFECLCIDCADNNICKVGPHPTKSEIRCFKPGHGVCSKACESDEEPFRCLNFVSPDVPLGDPVDVLLVYCACCENLTK